MTEYKIESGIAIPKKKSARYAKGTGLLGKVGILKVGESIFRRDISGTKSSGQSIVSSAGRIVTGRFPERRFTTRVVTEDGVKGVRIWRIEDAEPSLRVAAE